ncbi:ultraviolet-B receptor UVR8 [Punica granatum]|uniref:Ultraviolet-B receptor UVR8 n=1 Tax=Punica granatum TaxID=22663 RepID=A0A6P8E2E7_PUNGR|nr:ultraviolet-B receptor UVR8 [Punica granatum]
MADRNRLALFDDLPSHLILEILSCGRLSVTDLVYVELTSKVFGGSHGLYPHKFRSLVEFAAFQLCRSHPLYAPMSLKSKKEIFDRCDGNWKRLLRFLQSVEQSSDMVVTPAGNMQVTTGRYHTLLLHESSVYSCGSCLSGVLGHSAEITQCVAFTPISFPYPAHVLQVSASHNHAAFVMQSGEVFTCGDNSSYCCGHRDTARPIFKPRLVEALKDVPCKQVASGLSFTVFLTRQGQVYSCGSNTYGQLGHGDTLERPTPKVLEQFKSMGPIVQVAAGPSYVLAVAESGTVYSFGSGQNFCLGHGEQHNEFQPRQILSFRRRGIHVVRVSAGDEHAVALDSNGLVYTWGKGYCGALGHGDEIDKTTPELIDTLKSHIAVQVCARKRKTFVLIEHGFVYGFGWMGFGSLGFPDRGASDKVLRPRVLECLRSHRISQISTGLYHTIAITATGRMFGFGDNERAQLGHDMLRGCLEPTEIFIQQMEEDDTGMVTETA